MENKPNNSIDFEPVSVEEAAKVESPAIPPEDLDAKYEVSKSVDQKPEDIIRAQEIKDSLILQEKLPTSPEIKSEENTVEGQVKENQVLNSLMSSYGDYGRKMGPSDTPENTVKSGLDFERLDIKEKSTVSGVTVIGGGMLSLLGLAAANSAGQGVLSSGVSALLTSGTIEMTMLGATSVVGPVIAVGGAAYLLYQGVRKIKNMINTNRARKVFA